MTHSIAELKEKRAAKVAELRSIVDRAKSANRNFTETEQKEWDKVDGERRSLTQAIDRENLLAKMEREMDAEPVTPARDSCESEARNFRIANAIQAHMPDSNVEFETNKETGEVLSPVEFSRAVQMNKD